VRVAVFHSRYLSGPASGENRVLGDDIKLLTDAGHEVRSWTPSPGTTPREQAKAAVQAVWSVEAVARVRELVGTWGAEIVHCHNLFPLLSPAVIREASAQGAGVVMTLHNYRLMCLAGSFHRDGHTCEECLGRTPWRGVAHRCYRGSAAASGVLATSLITHRSMKTFDRVDRFMAVSGYVKQKHVEAGISTELIGVAPQFAWPTARREGPGEYFLYLGRLTQEKGANSLVEAWRQDLGRLVVVGDGPEMAHLRAVAPSAVELHGVVSGDEVPALLRGARALLVPSLAHDPAPRSVTEAYAAGVPVVASRRGGLPEIVRDGESGLLVAAGVADEWAAAVGRLSDDTEAIRLGAGAWRLWSQMHSPEHSLERLEKAYATALEHRGMPLAGRAG
jgi:glycosyltransferase involved in cell wall biosynthesis